MKQKGNCGMKTKHNKCPLCQVSVATLGLAVALLGASPAIRADTIYVSNYGGNTIEKFNSVTGADLGTFARTGLNGPEGLAFDSAGNLFVSNDGNNSIMKFTPGGTGTVFATYPTDPNLFAPEGLAFDKAGNLYVANWFGNTIEKFTPDGVGSIFASGLNYPAGLAFDNGGNLYAANYGNDSIEKFTPDGVGSSFASSISGPEGLAFDAAGNLFVANANNQTIEKFTPGGIGSVFASGLKSPLSLAVDSAGTLYVVNESAAFNQKNDIEKFAPDGTYLGVLTSTGVNEPFFIAIQVPEPSSLSLLTLSGVIMMRRRGNVRG
jgi:DNA-binding beta-propeller fold protein YncE